MKLRKSKKSSAVNNALNVDDDDFLDQEVQYWAGNSFSSIASSVTSPPSMTGSFYKKNLNDMDFGDDDDISISSDDDDDEDREFYGCNSDDDDVSFFG